MASLLKKDLEYRHESNAVSLINMHFIFIPKRRKAVASRQNRSTAARDYF